MESVIHSVELAMVELRRGQRSDWPGPSPLSFFGKSPSTFVNGKGEKIVRACLGNLKFGSNRCKNRQNKIKGGGEGAEGRGRSSTALYHSPPPRPTRPSFFIYQKVLKSNFKDEFIDQCVGFTWVRPSPSRPSLDPAPALCPIPFNSLLISFQINVQKMI